MRRWEELGMTAEQYVRSRWEGVYIGDLSGHWYTDRTCAIHLGASLDEAGAFTVKHEEAIRQKREEIAWCSQFVGNLEFCDCKGRTVLRRILSILGAQLAELLKGWKEQG